MARMPTPFPIAEEHFLLQQHFHALIDFWGSKRIPDHPGFHSLFDHQARNILPQLENVLMQGRLLYVFAEGIRAGHEQASEHARYLLALLPERYRNDRGWYCSRYDGSFCNPHILDSYSNLFVVMGLARYHQATGDAWAGMEAWRLFRCIETVCSNGALADGGILGHNDEADRLIGYFKSGTCMPKYSGNVLLHYLECLARLQDAGLGEDLAQRAQQLRALFLRHTYCQDHGCTVDYYDGGWDRYDLHRTGQLGHTMEWVDFFSSFPEARLPEALERRILDDAVRLGLRANGIFQSNYYFRQRCCGGLTDFWMQPEATKVFNMAAGWYGEPYAEAALRCWRAYREFFIAPDGGVYYQIDGDGVIVNEIKGSAWKCDFHAIRMLADLNRFGILHEHAVELKEH
ncbi:MAG: AGE family epimerase/isomerase [Planctomycetota bacterium]